MLAGLWNEGSPLLEDFSSRDMNMYYVIKAVERAVHIPSCLWHWASWAYLALIM